MTATAEIFMLGRDNLAGELAAELDGASVSHNADAYEALMELGRRPWPTVVVWADQTEFEGLCRAVRRLQKDTRLVALCEPSVEPRVRRMVGDVLDDYFLYPADREELASLIGGAAPAGRASVDELSSPAVAGGLPTEDVARLISSASTVASLETALTQLVSKLAGAPVAWTDLGKLNPDLRPLLTGQTPQRVLAPDHSTSKLDGLKVATMSSLQSIASALFEQATRTESLHRLAITDHLTGAYNRRYFYHLTEQVLDRARTAGSRASLLLYDIDNFKRYNETYGYAAGDEILRQTAGLMKTISRSHDIVARIGGDEFAVLFWDADQPRAAGSQPIQTAYDLSERFRLAVSRQQFPLLGPEAVGVLTISGGLASFPSDGVNVRHLMRAADKALKQARKNGKNAIHLIGSDRA